MVSVGETTRCMEFFRGTVVPPLRGGLTLVVLGQPNDAFAESVRKEFYKHTIIIQPFTINGTFALPGPIFSNKDIIITISNFAVRLPTPQLYALIGYACTSDTIAVVLHSRDVCSVRAHITKSYLRFDRCDILELSHQYTFCIWSCITGASKTVQSRPRLLSVQE